MASFWEENYDCYPLFSLFIIFTCPTLFSIFLFLFRGKNADIVDEKRRTVLRQVLVHVLIVALQKHWQCIENSFWAIFLIYFTQPDVDSQQKLPSRTKTVTKNNSHISYVKTQLSTVWHITYLMKKNWIRVSLTYIYVYIYDILNRAASFEFFYLVIFMLQSSVIFYGRYKF